MPEFLQDPNVIVTIVIGVATIIIGIVTVFVAIAIARSQRRYKRLSYEVTSGYPIVSVDREFPGDIQCFYGGEQIEDLDLVFVDVENIGNESVRSADYESPIEIIFEEEARILDCQTLSADAHPRNVDVSATTDSNKVTVEPILLNAGDIISVGAMVTSFTGYVEVRGRIAGVKEIERKKEPPDRLALARRLALVTSVTAFAFGIVAIIGPLSAESPSPSLNVATSAAVGVAGVTSVVASYQLVRLFRRLQDR